MKKNKKQARTAARTAAARARVQVEASPMAAHIQVQASKPEAWLTLLAQAALWVAPLLADTQKLPRRVTMLDRKRAGALAVTSDTASHFLASAVMDSRSTPGAVELLFLACGDDGQVYSFGPREMVAVRDHVDFLTLAVRNGEVGVVAEDLANRTADSMVARLS